MNRRWLDKDSAASLCGTVGLSGPYDFLPIHGATLKRIFAPAGGDLATSQPISYARGDAAPMLLMSGVTDKTVSPENSRKLAARIRSLGGQADTRFYSRASHVTIMAAFSPLLRAVAPSLADTLAFIGARAHAVRPRPGSPSFHQRSRSA